MILKRQLTKEQEEIFGEIYYQNRLKINKIFTKVFSFISLVLLVIALFDFVISTFFVADWCRIVVASSSAVMIAISIFCHYTKIKATAITYILSVSLILYSSLLYFLFSSTISLFVLPILIATMYYDKKLIIINSVLVTILVAIILALGIFLERVSPVIQNLHQVENIIVFKYPREVWIYSFLPKVVIIIFGALIGLYASSNGKAIVVERAISFNKVLKLKHELNTASEIQRRILPKENFVSKNKEIKLFTFMNPAKETAGDFYDYFYYDNDHLVFLIADVSDKGLSSAMYMMMAKNTIKICARNSENIADAIKRANKILYENNDSMFTTLWIGSLDISTGEIEYVNAGHLFPIIRKKDGSILEVKNKPDLFLGPFENTVFKLNKTTLDKGEMLFLYTDGITDALNKAQESFGKERLIEALKKDNFTAEQCCKNVLNSIEQFSGGTYQFDDLTIMGIEREDGDSDELVKEILVPSTEDKISEIIDTINKFLENVSTEDARRNIDVVIDEVCTNICEHSISKNMTIQYSLKGNNFEMKFIDSGRLFNPLDALVEKEDVLALGGNGINLIKNLMDKVEYSRENSQNILTLTKDITK